MYSSPIIATTYTMIRFLDVDFSLVAISPPIGAPIIWQPYCLKIAAHPAITTGIPSTSEKYGVKYVSVVMKEYTAKIQNANIQVSL